VRMARAGQPGALQHSKIAVPLTGVSSGISRLLTDNRLTRSARPQHTNTSLCKQGVKVSQSQGVRTLGAYTSLPIASTAVTRSSSAPQRSCSATSTCLSPSRRTW
jgi:hypothetical protein